MSRVCCGCCSAVLAAVHVNMLTRRLGPRDLVFATASAVSLETVSSAIRQASLLKLSGGERAAVAVAPFALIILSSCFPPSTIDTLAFCPKGHQHKQQPGRDGRGSMIGWAGEKTPEPLKVVSVLSFFPVLPNFTLCKICKIRQVVFTTCLNWLLKPLLKRICTEGRNKVAKIRGVGKGALSPGPKRGSNFRDYS